MAGNGAELINLTDIPTEDGFGMHRKDSLADVLSPAQAQAFRNRAHALLEPIMGSLVPENGKLKSTHADSYYQYFRFDFDSDKGWDAEYFASVKESIELLRKYDIKAFFANDSEKYPIALDSSLCDHAEGLNVMGEIIVPSNQPGLEENLQRLLTAQKDRIPPVKMTNFPLHVESDNITTNMDGTALHPEEAAKILAAEHQALAEKAKRLGCANLYEALISPRTGRARGIADDSASGD